MSGAALSHGRRLFRIFAIATAACIAGQFLLAGMAIFGAGDAWDQHGTLGGLTGAIILAMLAVGLMVPSPAVLRWKTAGLFALYAVQILLVAAAQQGGLPLLGAFHPLNGMAMALLAVDIVRHAWHEPA